MCKTKANLILIINSLFTYFINNNPIKQFHKIPILIIYTRNSVFNDHNMCHHTSDVIKNFGLEILYVFRKICKPHTVIFLTKYTILAVK